MILFAVVVFIIACTPRSSYKSLSVFFDGVPNPDVIDSIARADSLSKIAMTKDAPARDRVRTEYVFHPPYVDKECASCHDQGQMGKLLEPMPGLCYQCHEDFADQFEVLHGPVGGGFCTECHNPHLTKDKHLLVRTGQDLCLGCHNTNDVFSNEVHEDIEDADCTECHNPHGGDDRFIFN
ncbi:MAG: hypothetical protein L3J31_07180 [Bacteroidales bacterium]|nr:hypothetical protein [Bacteroidales bacterium]